MFCTGCGERQQAALISFRTIIIIIVRLIRNIIRKYEMDLHTRTAGIQNFYNYKQQEAIFCQNESLISLLLGSKLDAALARERKGLLINIESSET